MESTQMLILKKEQDKSSPIDSNSLILIRLGELCNFKCPMCPLSGSEEHHIYTLDTIFQKIDFVFSQGFRQVVITGGEPLAHPQFRQIAERLGKLGIRWKVNSNASLFTPELAKICRANQLHAAIISLHSHQAESSSELFGSSKKSHHQTVQGIHSLLKADIEVMINCVLTKLNLPILADYVEFVSHEFGHQCAIKFAFPNGKGIGRQWDGVQLSLTEIQQPLRDASVVAKRLSVPLHYEGIPNCNLTFVDYRNFSRSEWGETHYLSESGFNIVEIQSLENDGALFAYDCKDCLHVGGCSGVTSGYFLSHGFSELNSKIFC